MMEINWIEAFGYLGSVTVALSLMMANIKKLRWLNLIGAAIFTIYGAIIGAYPVMALNAWICLTNIYFLKKIYGFKDDFDIISGTETHGLIDIFFKYHDKDIKRFFPGFTDKWKAYNAVITLRNTQPVGLLIYKNIDKETIEILMDYVTPDVRDLKNAKFLWGNGLTKIKSLGVKTLITKTDDTEHKKYLSSIGFKLQGDLYSMSI